MSPKPRFLMCPPEHFGVEYVINPWMQGQIHETNGCIARRQWEALSHSLAQHADVRFMEPVAGLPDLVFTANAAVILREVAVLSNFRCRERQPEASHYMAALEAQDLKVQMLPSSVRFEGAGDALLDRKHKLLWMGHGFRSDLTAQPYLEEAIGVPVQALHLINPSFYHLDTCFCPLEGGYLLYYAGAFDEASNATIEALVPEDCRLAVADPDACHFACNAVNIEDQVFTNFASVQLRDWLLERGLSVNVTPLTEFMKAGGSAKCLTLRLDES